MLLGAIVSATDGAAIFGLLRQSRLRPRLARALEAESGLNDPVAVLLVVGLIDWIQLPDYGLGDMLLLLVKQLAIGLAIGLAVGWVAVRACAAPGLAARPRT
jgi:potassium/hydrogen antiporter